MCATCFAQGSVYVGGALVSLRAMGARAKLRRSKSVSDDDELEACSEPDQQPPSSEHDDSDRPRAEVSA